MFPGETILSGAPQVCGPKPGNGGLFESPFFDDDWEMHPKDEDGRPITVDVLWDVYQSGAGYYIGTFCPHCGPHTRESEYFSSREKAEAVYKYWLDYILDGTFDISKRHSGTDANIVPLPGQRY